MTLNIKPWSHSRITSQPDSYDVIQPPPATACHVSLCNADVVCFKTPCWLCTALNVTGKIKFVMQYTHLKFGIFVHAYIHIGTGLCVCKTKRGEHSNARSIQACSAPNPQAQRPTTYPHDPTIQRERDRGKKTLLESRANAGLQYKIWSGVLWNGFLNVMQTDPMVSFKNMGPNSIESLEIH